jgi:hypothetical protein
MRVEALSVFGRFSRIGQAATNNKLCKFKIKKWTEFKNALERATIVKNNKKNTQTAKHSQFSNTALNTKL